MPKTLVEVNPWALRHWMYDYPVPLQITARVLHALHLHEEKATNCPIVHGRRITLTADTDIFEQIVFVPSEEMSKECKASLLQAVGLRVEDRFGKTELVSILKRDRKPIVL